MKQALRMWRSLTCASIASIFIWSTISPAQAQTANPVETVVAQITSSAFNSYAGDISGNGRFVVIESSGDIATERTAARNNADGNREIFLFDYAQRRIFQITHTTSRRKDTTRPAMDPAAPDNLGNIAIEVSNNRPVISHNGRWIAFSSNATNPANFDGDANGAALAADGNQEIYLYFIPAAPAVDLSSGAEQPLTDLSAGSFTRITDTPASRLPTPSTDTSAPFVADDNRAPFVNDNASIVAFVSTRNISNVSGVTNADTNPEIFVYNRLNGTIAQVTNTQSTCVPGNCPFIFSDNPNLSGDGSVLAYTSNANPTGENTDGNGEIFVGSYNGAAIVGLQQVTRTTRGENQLVVINQFSPGRRLSRNGNLLAFESAADLTGNSAVQDTGTVFIYNIATRTFTQVGPRAPSDLQDIVRFPTFTGDGSTIVFASRLNFRADGTIPTTASEGLNPNLRAQIFSAPVTAPNTFTRLTNTPQPATANELPSMQPFVSDTIRRIAFSLRGTELGGGNPDNNSEAFYLLALPQTSETPATANAVSFATGASNRPVTGPSPTPPAVAGLAPGMLGIARSSLALAPGNQQSNGSTARRPALPIELNGVTLSIGGAAAGLYFVSPGQINFVAPVGLAAATYPVGINNNGAVIRSSMQILAAQPDIFSSTLDAGGRALVFLSGTMVGEPFTVTAADDTVVSILLTGIRNVQRSQVTVTLGTGDSRTDISGDRIILVGPTATPGWDQIDVRLPPTLAGTGDRPLVVTVTIGGVATTSRPADTAPRVTIN